MLAGVLVEMFIESKGTGGHTESAPQVVKMGTKETGCQELNPIPTMA